MVQETAIAEGTDVMWSDEANDGITNLQQAGANIDNLQAACTSTSSSGGTKKIRNKRNKITRRRKKNKGTKRNKKAVKQKKTRKIRGGGEELLEPLVPPIFTKMNTYIQDNLNEDEKLDDSTLDSFIAKLPINARQFIDYEKMSKDLFGSDIGNAYKIDNINKRIAGTSSDKLLFMNFKSHNIFPEDSRKKLFQIIKTTKPNYICLTEALVPTSIADIANRYAKIQSKMRFNNRLESDVLIQTEPVPEQQDYDTEEDKKDDSDNAVVDIAYIHSIDISIEDKVEQPYRAYNKFTNNKMEKNKNEVLTLENVWIAFFKEQGYKYIIFANPRRCPYGKNWGNCIISKQEPISAKIVQMTPIKIHELSAMADAGDPETRCMIHAEFVNDNILCTHLEDKDSEKRKKQTNQIINYIKSSVYSNNKNITLVGDLNAINKSSYEPNELLLLNKLSLSPVPTDAVDSLNEFFKERVPLINTGQKYESLYQKCVSHAYSNMYKKSLLIFTDATNYDHQPLLLVKDADSAESAANAASAASAESAASADRAAERAEVPKSIPSKEGPQRQPRDSDVPESPSTSWFSTIKNMLTGK